MEAAAALTPTEGGGRRRRRRRVLLALLLLVAVLVGNAWLSDLSDGADLTALKQDAMSRFRPSVGTLDYEREAKADDGGFMSKPSYAEVRRTYVLTEQQAMQAFDEAVAAALAAGWQPDPRSAYPRRPDEDPWWTGGKNFFGPDPWGSWYPAMRLSIGLQVSLDPANPGAELYISLDHN
jgi:hypothetical protein